MNKMHLREHIWIPAILLFVVLSWGCRNEYRADSLAVTDEVRRFVAEHMIAGSDMEIVQAILEITHNPSLFIKIDRPMLKTWILDPELAIQFKESIAEKQVRLDALQRKARESILTVREAQERHDLLRDTFYGYHNLRIFHNLLRHKKMKAADLAFVVSGDEAIRHRARDGCTTMAHVFIALAKAAGIQDVRFLVGANVSELMQACPQSGRNRRDSVEIDGHMVAVVKVDGHWAIVNCTYLEPYSTYPDVRYEILTSIEGEEIVPERLRGRILRFPSYQREGFPPSELLIVGVGSNPDDDLEVENHTALMNLSASGNPRDPTCRWTLPVRR